MEYGAFGRAVGQQGFDDLAMGVAVVNLHGQAQFLGQGNMRAESLALQFLGTFAGAEEVHAGLADSHHLLGVCGGEAMYFGERVLERRVMVRLVFEGQTIRPRHTAMPVEHGLIGVYCERRVHITWMIEGHLDGGHQVRQLATAVDNTPNADRLRLRQQLVDVVHRDFGLSLLLRLMAHSARERDYGGHVSVVVDGLGVVRQCFRCRGPATVAMVVLAHGFSV